LAAQKSWTACSPGATPMRSYSDSYSATKGHDSQWVVMALNWWAVQDLNL
jgi:hypothetical protein